MELNKVMKLKTIVFVLFARFHFYNTHVFKGHLRSGPFRGRRSGGSCFKIPSQVILKSVVSSLKGSFS